MAQARKYATLPDLDSAPDIFETSEAVDDSSKSKTAPSPSSPASSDSETDAASASSDAEAEASETTKPSRIDRHSNRPAVARDTFSGSRVDARGVDFSDQITDGKRSYRVPLGRKSRRRRREREGGGYVNEYGDFSDEDDEEESFAEKLARLRREVAEMKSESDRLAQEDGEKIVNGKRAEHEDAQDGIVELGEILNTLQTKRRSTSRLERADAAPAPTGQLPRTTETEDAVPAPPTSAQPNNEEVDRIMSKAAEFEARLAQLENSLGASNQAVATGSKTSPIVNKNVLATLGTLEAQFSTLSSTTIPTLESMNHQVRQLTEDASRLEQARTAARAALDRVGILRSPSFTPHPTHGAVNGTEASTSASAGAEEASSLPEDAEQATRLIALYNTLPTIEAVAPLVPALLERLKSLRVLHADAAVARENLAELGKTQARMEDDIRGWREGLERAEKAVTASEETGDRNSKAVEEWVRDLEARLEAFTT